MDYKVKGTEVNGNKYINIDDLITVITIENREKPLAAEDLLYFLAKIKSRI